MFKFRAPDAETLKRRLELAEHQLEVDQQKFKTIFAASATSMGLLRGPEFIFEIINPSYSELFNGRELIGRPLLEALPELRGQEFPNIMAKVFKSGITYVDREAQAFLRRTEHGPIEERYFDQTYSRMNDISGEPYGIYIHAREVTDLVFARRALEASSESLRAAIDIADIGTWSVDLVASQVNWSERCAQLFGLDGKLKNNLDDIFSRIVKGDRERVQKAVLDAQNPEDNGQFSADYRVRRQDGELVWISVLGKVLFHETPQGRAAQTILGVALDVTERVNAAAVLKDAKERAERANAAKSQFLANMSHEIRTPLGAIMGFASLLRDPGNGVDQQDGFLSVIERNSIQLLRIIDDILDLSKIEAGMMLIEQIEFSLTEILADFSSLMGFKAREKGIGFFSVAETPLPSRMTSDPIRIRQILMNVVGNAIKFTDKGGVELRSTYRDGFLEFEVRDTGRGISHEQETNLFQPFSQADASITRKYGGTGLGLVLTRSLCEAMGGDFILATSALDKGSVFRARVAIVANPSAEFVTELGFEVVPVRSVEQIGQLSGVRVLLVEDSPDNQALLSIYLRKAGARIDIAENGLRGYSMAMTGDYDVVLMDVQMPVMDGISAVKRLRAEGFLNTVIALTAHAMKEERLRCLDAGFTDFLSKPVSRNELIDKILHHRLVSAVT